MSPKCAYTLFVHFEIFNKNYFYSSYIILIMCYKIWKINFNYNYTLLAIGKVNFDYILCVAKMS